MRIGIVGTGQGRLRLRQWPPPCAAGARQIMLGQSHPEKPPKPIATDIRYGVPAWPQGSISATVITGDLEGADVILITAGRE